MWRRQNQAPVDRSVVYDPRSLAVVWVVDDASGEYIAVPYRVPRADMTLAESEAARAQLRTLKAADRTEARLSEIVRQVRAIEERGRTATARMKAERSRQARRAAPRPAEPGNLADTSQDKVSGAVLPLPWPAVPIKPFADVEDL